MPAACLQGSGALESALAAAPGAVRIGGRRPSQCFAHASSQGDVENLGSIFVEAAEHLATDARARPHGPALLRLGFLIGAAHRGGDSAQGIYSELLRRLDSVVTGIGTSSPAYRRGRAAGRDHG